MSSNRRRLVAGSSGRRVEGARSNGSAGSASLDLPPYEPPACPLNEEGKRALKDLSSSRTNDTLRKHLSESQKLLTSVTHDTLVTAADREGRAANMTDKDAKKKTAAVESAKEYKEKVSPLIIRLEQSMREVLDMEAALQDEKQTLQDLPTLVAQAQASLAQENEQEDDGDDADPHELPGVPILQILETERNRKITEYNKFDMQARYAEHNSYIDFRRNWTFGLCATPEARVPHPSTWWDEDGNPQQIVDGANDNADDDIQVESEKKSFRCPLSLVEMTEPYTCRSCGHSFQKKSIIEYLQGKADPAPCPEAGCNVTDLTIDDFYFDQPLMRQIQRSHQSQEPADSSVVDPEEEKEGEQGKSEDEDNMEVDSVVGPKAETINND